VADTWTGDHKRKKEMNRDKKKQGYQVDEKGKK
jgi:hypothetical protein